MTTYISDHRARRLADIEQRERQAWEAYSDSLQGLGGRDYEEAEGESWDRLQQTLRELDDERQLVAGA
ncbi:MAG: hypothetical protein QOD66_948 [Solirubrobacteraceae bacterium]|jgi:hypothetical protein|nr:hypothetical protein [Solirubrobacteraceae bacterium]MEA2398560.1 hypothetical protein [Thermoleophilaceae bacterium]